MILFNFFLHQAVASEDEKVGLKHPGLMLKYSTYKNLASLAVLRDDLDTAMDFYVQVNAYFEQMTKCKLHNWTFMLSNSIELHYHSKLWGQQGF